RPEPALELVENGGRFATAQLGAPGRVVTGTSIDLVERTDPLEGALCVGMVGRGLFELAVGVRPAACQDHARAVAGASLVRLESVADDHAAVVADEVREGRGALVVADPVHDHAGCRETPHLPGLGRLA